jgi:hypothetical protein
MQRVYLSKRPMDTPEYAHGVIVFHADAEIVELLHRPAYAPPLRFNEVWVASFPCQYADVFDAERSECLASGFYRLQGTEIGNANRSTYVQEKMS